MDLLLSHKHRDSQKMVECTSTTPIMQLSFLNLGQFQELTHLEYNG